MTAFKINEIETAFAQYLQVTAPTHHIQYINGGDYPKPVKPSIFITTSLESKGSPRKETDQATLIQTIKQPNEIGFVCDFVGKGAQAVAARAAALIKSDEAFKNIYKTAGFLRVLPIKNLSKIENAYNLERTQTTFFFSFVLNEMISVDIAETLPTDIKANK